MMLLNALLVESLKLRRSLILMLTFIAPSMIAFLLFMMLVTGNGSSEWNLFVLGGAAMWGFFMLPMTATAITTLLAQVEHGPRMWTHLLALPTPRWSVFLAKTLIAIGLVAFMSVLLAALLIGAGTVGGWLKPSEALTGSIPWGVLALTLGTMFLASWLLIVIQLWVALRFQSFVVPLTVGIGGTFIAVAATAARAGKYFPWLLPMNVMSSDQSRMAFVIALGSIGGVLLALLMIVHLSRREVLSGP